MFLVRWYWEMTRGQRKFCWLIALASIFLCGIGILFTIILIYSHLGKEKYIAELAAKAAIVNAVLSEDENR